MNDILFDLAALLRERDGIEAEIADAADGSSCCRDVGRFIAARVFDIDLTPHATDPCHTGRFTSGPLTGQTVTVTTDADVVAADDVLASAGDYHLILRGPGRCCDGVGHHRFRISEVYLLHARRLRKLLSGHVGGEPGTRLPYTDLTAARLYPAEGREALLHLTRDQRSVLSLFS
jgi:hypothetical protein